MIIVSGGLYEFDVQRLLDDGAPIDTFGVGTKAGVSADGPSLETVYKLVDYAGRPTMKRSPGKQTRPGAKQVYRQGRSSLSGLGSIARIGPPTVSPDRTVGARVGTAGPPDAICRRRTSPRRPPMDGLTT